MSFILGAAIIGGASLIGSAVSGGMAASAAKKNRRRAQTTQDKIDEKERNRQDIIDPFAGMTSLDSMLSNQFDNLQVATGAADFQREMSDVNLANMTDQALRFGYGGGGATALAFGANRSSREIANILEQQEAKNSLMRAQGAQDLMGARVGEARRIQSMRAQGEAYKFETQENRDIAQLDRLAGLQTGYQTNANALQQQSLSIFGSAIPNAVSAGLGAAKQFG
jgi:hypothetical protein